MSKKKDIKRTWVVSKIVRAETLEEALKKEKRTKPVEVRLAVLEKEQLESAIGFDCDMRNYEDDEWE